MMKKIITRKADQQAGKSIESEGKTKPVRKRKSIKDIFKIIGALIIVLLIITSIITVLMIQDNKKVPVVCERNSHASKSCKVDFKGIRIGCKWVCESNFGPDLKPVIYLYPTQKQETKVTLDYEGEIFADYPEYDKEKKGWEVVTYPDGKIINKADNKEYSYLFWEGVPAEKVSWDLSTGFMVKGEDTKEFLQKTLSEMGLTPREYNEFIVYWFPKMQSNKYNLIHFAGEKYTDLARLEVNPKADSVLRVFMVVKPLDEFRQIKPQKIDSFKREGFTVIEWGGTEIK